MNTRPFRLSSILIFSLLVAGLYLTHLYSYLLFHSLAEVFSIVIGFTLFIIALLAVVAVLLSLQRSRFAPAVHRKLLLSVVFTILSELAFTVYLLNDDLVNLLGHVFKIVSFYLIYEAIVITCITEPYETIFKELTDKEEMLSRAALTDELTGLYNRHYLDLTSGDLLARSDRYGEPLAMAIVDLDHFKAINDTWGHPAGDEALRHVAGVMGQHIRAADILARIGGEEFVIIMPQTSLDGARTAGEQLRNAIRNSPMPPPVSGLHTASVGIAERQPGESFRNWYRRADEALYRAKQNGRDRVETAVAPAAAATSIQEVPA